MNHKEIARTAARTMTHGLLQQGVAADDIADALMVQALAIWATETGRHTDAETLLTLWTLERDSHGR